MVKKLLLLFFSFVIVEIHLLAQEVAIPDLKNRVTDLTGTLSSAEIDQLERRLSAHEQEMGGQVAVLVIPTTGDESIEQYSIRVAESWKIGREEVDDGVIFLVAMEDRKMRIEVGYGLEGALTDAQSKRIITNVVTPEFRSGHYYKGISAGVEVILSAIQGEDLPPVVREDHSDSSSSGPGWIVPVAIIGFILTGFMKVLLTKKLGKGKATGISALVVFVLGWIFIGLFVGLFIAAIVSIFMSVPSNGRGGRGGRGGGFYGGGFGGGGFSGGGGFGGGGFSGGGGGFGGGGASGGW